MSGDRAPHDAAQPDEHTERLDLGIVIAMLGGGPPPDPGHADVPGPPVEELAAESRDRL